MKKLFLALSIVFIASQVFAGELWAPIEGYSSITQKGAYNRFRFTSLVVGQYKENETYEHETQVYNKNFADYAGRWRSDMPAKYYDTQIFDFPPFAADIDNFTVGSEKAMDLRDGKNYFTFILLKKGNGSNCQGCCSSHGGVVCSNGVAHCADGKAFSLICVLKGCNECLNKSLVLIKGQRGSFSDNCPFESVELCTDPDDTTNAMCVLNAPANQDWKYGIK